MPTPLIQVGLPNVPAGLPETESRLLLPIYLALNSLAQKVSTATGLTIYSQEEKAQGNQAATMLAGNLSRVFLKATVAIGFGKMCNIVLSGGKLGAQLADSANNTKPAQCVCNEPLGLSVGEYGEFLLYTGFTAGITGTAIGAQYYLGTAGNSQAIRPSAAGTIIQAVGTGLGSLGFYTQISSLFIQN